MLNERVLESLEQSRVLLVSQQIDLTKRLRELEKLMPKKRTAEDYSVFKQKRKKEGFVYCVRYYVNGKVLPTKFSLKTTDRAEAEERAAAWKDLFLANYGIQGRRGNAFYTLLSGYYTETSKYLLESLQTKRRLNKRLIKIYNSFINNYFIPFLKQEGITKIENLKPEKILKFSGRLREEKKLTAKTINDYVNGAVKQAIDFLFLKEKIQYNPFSQGVNTNIKPIKGEVKRRQIYPVNRLFDVLFEPGLWILGKTRNDLENPQEKQIRRKKYLLCLIAATTGLRAGEVFMLKKSSIEKIGGLYFLKIDNSRLDNSGVKTENAYRRVPLHNFVYKAINEYIEKMNITGDYLFFSGKRKTQNGTIFIEAYRQCGIHCGYTEEEIKENNVDFHSFRHFYRTILSQGGVSKELVAYFMGHAKNMNDMEDRYNNIEEVGNDISDIKLLADNAKKVIGILSEHFKNSFLRHIEEHDQQILYLTEKEVELTNAKGEKVKYWTYAIKGYENFIEFEPEKFIDDEPRRNKKE
ncbi:MAG: tyrosine-type recombinase/integrase [Treponema sp.]|jgi:integrase|nr:tyrosine-type recombinase/integrase [Treponema sp.]